GWAGRPPSQAARALTGDRRRSRRLAGDLDTIAGKALERDPQRRYGTAAALAEDLERHLAQRPVRARRPTVAYRLGRAVVRHKLASVFVLSVVLLAGALGYQTLALARQNEQTRRQKTRAEDLAGFLINLFRIADPGESRGEEVTAGDRRGAHQPGVVRRGEDRPRQSPGAAPGNRPGFGARPGRHPDQAGHARQRARRLWVEPPVLRAGAGEQTAAAPRGRPFAGGGPERPGPRGDGDRRPREGSGLAHRIRSDQPPRRLPRPR